MLASGKRLRIAIVALAAGLLLGTLALWRSREAGRRVGPAWVSRITDVTRAQRPNLLLVVYDARRRDDFSFGPFGNRRGDTPFLARFKDEAIYFEDALAPGCWTVPVHAAIFSGLSVCELGNDYYNPGWSAFPSGVLSLAEILKLAGYHTVAYPDHPYFYNSHEDVALVRGFEQFNVISDFETYTSATNIGAPAGRVVHEPRLEVRHKAVPRAVLVEAVQSFNAGERAAEEGEADRDPSNDVLLASLAPLFRQSEYFQERYAREFESHVFGSAAQRRPFFLFLNLHMATVARPDPGLYARWALETLILNARARRKLLLPPAAEENLDAWLEANAAALGLRHAPFSSAATYLKHVFDNRFYDASFEAVWQYLEERGLTKNTVTVVTSDHGMSLRENGETLYLHSGARPYQYIVGTPLVIRFPKGSVDASLHGRYSDVVSLIDLFPTLVDLGLGPGTFERALPIRGQNLVSRLRSRSFEPYLVTEATWGPSTYSVAPGAMGYSKAVISGRLKLIHANETFIVPRGGPGWPITARLDGGWSLASPRPVLHRFPEGIDLLFDLVADPGERNDLSRERPEEVARLKALVRSWSCRSLPWGPAAPIWQGESLATLRSLGYIQ
jgi:arylsulfatase A-like enzyme